MIDSVVMREMARQRIPGVAVAVIRRGVVMLAKGYGHANLEHGIPVTDSTMFQSGSLGKQFTSAGIMALVEDGKVQLDASVRTYLPEAPVTWQPITIRHLLTHTSGLPDYTGEDFDYRRDYTEAELLALAARMPLEFEAGSRWNYSNTGYVVLGIVMHRVSGVEYWDYLRARIFGPAGMPTIRVISESAIVPHRASGYLVDGTGWRHQNWVAPLTNTVADGSMLLSLRDMIAWNEAVRHRRVLRADTWSQILAPLRLTSGRPYPYGFGWFIDSAGGGVVHQHGGSWQGFQTQFTRYTSNDDAIVVLTNLGSAAPAAIAESIAGILDSTYQAASLPDRPIAADPAVTQWVSGVLERAGSGLLTADDFSFVRATALPRLLIRLNTILKGQPAPVQLELLRRRVIGDDERYEYRVRYPSSVYLATVTRAPGGRLAGLNIRPLPAR